MMTGRQGHGMCIHEGRLYVAGGYIPSQHKDAARAIEIHNINTGSSQNIVCLRHSSIIGSGGGAWNIACCVSHDNRHLVVYGAFQDGTYKHTIQVVSLERQCVTHCLTVPFEQETGARSVLPVNNGVYVLVADHYTATVTWQDIVHNKPENISFCDKYAVPNGGCAVVLSDTKEHITLYGGVPKPGRPQHHVYSAPVQDIVTNSGRGWRKVPSQWPFGDCGMRGYDTIKVTV